MKTENETETPPNAEGTTLNVETETVSPFHEWFFEAMGISPEGRAKLIEMSALCRQHRRNSPLHPQESADGEPPESIPEGPKPNHD